MPVQKEAAWLERNTAGLTSSSTVAIRPSGVSASNCFRCSATSGAQIHRGQRIAGTYRVYTHAGVAPLHGETFGEMNHRRLRSVVVHLQNATIYDLCRTLKRY